MGRCFPIRIFAAVAMHEDLEGRHFGAIDNAGMPWLEVAARRRPRRVAEDSLKLFAGNRRLQEGSRRAACIQSRRNRPFGRISACCQVPMAHGVVHSRPRGVSTYSGQR
jgi:hypothetical protein